MKNKTSGILLIIFLLVSGHILGQTTSIENIKTISTKKAQKLAKRNVLLVDLRTPAEYAEKTYDVKHIINIPIDSLATNLNLIPKDEKVVLVCRTGNKSKKAYAVLEKNGYTNMVHMDGGIVKWSADGFAVATPKSTTCCKSSGAECKKECKTNNQSQAKSCCKKVQK